MKPLQIYHVSSQKGVKIEESSNYFTSEFNDIQEAKEMMVAQLPDLLIYQINEIREVKAIFHFLKALKKEVPTIISSEMLDKADAVDLIHSGAIDYIDLNDSDAEYQLKESINDTVSFIVSKEEMLHGMNQSSRHLKLSH
jgi:DNA-binding NtrC family response regulator